MPSLLAAAALVESDSLINSTGIGQIHKSNVYTWEVKNEFPLNLMKYKEGIFSQQN